MSKIQRRPSAIPPESPIPLGGKSKSREAPKKDFRAVAKEIQAFVKKNPIRPATHSFKSAAPNAKSTLKAKYFGKKAFQ